MKTLALSSILLVACGGAPFTVEETTIVDPPPDVATFPTVVPDAGEVTPEAAPLPEASAPEASSPPPVEPVEASASDASPCASDSVSGPFAFVPSSLDFGIVPVGSTVAKKILLVNQGACTTILDGIGGFGLDTDGFRDDTSCSYAHLVPGGSCFFDVTFTPGFVGPMSAMGNGIINGEMYSFNLAGVGQ
jgi:hypothetical protein